MPSQVQADSPFTAESEIHTYIETKIVVSYAFTQNVTSDAYSAGQSVWSVTIDPLVTTFTTSAADRFVWNLIVTYDILVEQSITVAVFSGHEPVDSWSYPIKARKIILQFKVIVTPQPQYPTAEQLAEMSVEVLSNELEEYTSEMRRQNDVTAQNLTVQWLVVLIVFAGWIITTIVPYVKPPKRVE
jgi:hypothetical protein